jgi:hypothetical protein
VLIRSASSGSRFSQAAWLEASSRVLARTARVSAMEASAASVFGSEIGGDFRVSEIAGFSEIAGSLYRIYFLSPSNL